MSPGEIVKDVADRFGEQELFLRASAIGFRLLAAVVPFGLFLVGLLGAFGLQDVYAREIEPSLKRDLSIPAFSVVDTTFESVLRETQLFWATAGLALSIWQLAGAIRAGGATLDRLYGRGRHPRPAREAIPISLLLAVAVAACVVGALAVAVLGPLLYGDVGPLLGALLALVRYLAAAALLLLAVGLVVRHAPAEPLATRWVTVGAVLVTVSWIVATAAVGAYLTAVASYGSIYGAFVTVVVLLAWVYCSALAFVAGIATDAVLRERST